MPKRSTSTITVRAAEAAPPGLLWDQEIPGFGLRTLASGRKSWLLKYTADERQRWHRIGSFPAMTLDQARKEARRLRSSVDLGRDPSGERVKAREATKLERAAAVAVLVAQYEEAVKDRPSLRGSGAISAAHASAEAASVRRAMVRMDLAARPVADVKPADILAFLHAEAARPATAFMQFSAFGRFLEWCREQGHIVLNPCDAIPRAKRPRPPAPRSRVVALPDLARLWLAADTLADPLGDLARMLIAVPVRRGEAARMAWQDIDLRTGAWTLPGAITKNGDAHRIAIPAIALSILRTRHKDAGRPKAGLVFPSPRAEKPVEGWTSIKTVLAQMSGFSAWTWHDFRRSFASLMAERGIAEPVADAVLNHRQSSTRGGVLGVYQHAERRPEQDAAMKAWGTTLAAAISAAMPKAKRAKAPPRPVETAPTPRTHQAPHPPEAAAPVRGHKARGAVRKSASANGRQRAAPAAGRATRGGA
jgi:integrase